MASSSRKRLFESTSSVDDTAQDATIHGVINFLSPVKKAKATEKPFFNGTITDGNKNMILVGFDDKQQQQLQQLMKDKESIEIKGCSIQKSSRTSQLEIHLKDSTKLQKSPTKFSIPDSVLQGESSLCTIATIYDKPIGEHVTVIAKVTQIKDPTKVRTGKIKRDATLTDASGSIRFTLWENQLDLVDLDNSYKIINAEVSAFRGTKYLSYPRENASISSAPDVDVGSTTEDLHVEPPQHTYIIVGVSGLLSYDACVSCKGKVESNTPLIGTCTKCFLKQKTNYCSKQRIAKLQVKEMDQHPIIPATAFTEAIESIVQHPITDSDADLQIENELLEASPFTCIIINDVISSVNIE